MPVMHPVIGLGVVRLFVAHFFDESGEHGAGNLLPIDLVYLAARFLRLFRLFYFRFHDLVQALAPPIELSLRSRPTGNFHHTIFSLHRQESWGAANHYYSNNYTGLYVLKGGRNKIENSLAVFD